MEIILIFRFWKRNWNRFQRYYSFSSFAFTSIAFQKRYSKWIILQVFPSNSGFADSLICFRELSQHDVYESDGTISLNPDVSGIDLVFSDMVAEIEKSSGDVVRNCMTEIQDANETTPEKNGRFPRQSYSLGAVYERLFGSKIPNAHTAEGDTIALLKCCQMYKETMLRWLDSNYASFDSIKSLY